MAETKEDIISRAVRTPEGCKALLEAMVYPIQRVIRYGMEVDEFLGDGTVTYRVGEDIEKWIIANLRQIEKTPHDRQLHGFVLCLMGGIATLLEMRMYQQALEDIESSIKQLDEYMDDAIDMEPMGGHVWTKEEVASVSDRMETEQLLTELEFDEAKRPEVLS